MVIESVVHAGKTRESLRVINASGQSFIIGKPETNDAMSSDPKVLLAARRKAHEKAVEVVMEHRNQLLRATYAV